MRCSRNDGKNWRCSEMAMPGHKHCQKHMRWSAGGRSKQRGGAAEGAAGAKRPRWLAEENGWAHGAPIAGFPPHVNGLAGAPNPLLAAPLLNAAASALDELRHKEAVLRAMSQGVSSAFGAFGGFPGATAFSGFPGPGQAGATHRPTASKAPISIDSLAGVAPALPTSPRGGGARREGVRREGARGRRGRWSATSSSCRRPRGRAAARPCDKTSTSARSTRSMPCTSRSRTSSAPRGRRAGEYDRARCRLRTSTRTARRRFWAPSRGRRSRRAPRSCRRVCSRRGSVTRARRCRTAPR